ncbi:MAG TPA: hypothetical protein VGM73_09705 [Candidatus Didemnitutus sp.]
MRFKANFPPSFSQTSEYNFADFFVAKIKRDPGRVFSSEKVRGDIGRVARA